MDFPTLSPSVLAGLPASQRKTVWYMGPGKTLFVGTQEECKAFKDALPEDVRIWCKIV